MGFRHLPDKFRCEYPEEVAVLGIRPACLYGCSRSGAHLHVDRLAGDQVGNEPGAVGLMADSDYGCIFVPTERFKQRPVTESGRKELCRLRTERMGTCVTQDLPGLSGPEERACENPADRR